MAFVFTYDSTTAELIKTIERHDETFISTIPMFFNLATNSLCQKFNILGLRTVYQSLMVPGEYKIPKPNLWSSNINFSIRIKDPYEAGAPNYNKTVFLPQRSSEYCDFYWPNKNIQGQPKYYAVDTHYEWYTVSPTPDVAYPFEVAFYAQLQSIDANNQTNFFTITIPNAFFYECLVHAAVWLGDQRITEWKPLRDEAIQAVSVEDLGRKLDGYSKRES